MGVFRKITNKHLLALASNAIMPVMGMITVSLLAHNMTEPDFGNWILFLITFTLANLFRSGFLQTSLVKFYSGATKERAMRIAGSTWYVAFFLTLTLCLVSLLAHLFYRGDASTEIIIKWFGIIFLSTLPSSIALWILQAEERFDRVFILQSVSQGCFFITVIILIFLHEISFQVVIYAYFFTAVVTSLFSILSGWARLATVRYKTMACIRELINFGKFSVGASISSYLLRGSDTFIIKYMFVDPSMVGVYYLPQRLMEVIEIPLRSFVATALPTMSAAVQRDDKAQMTLVMKKYASILTLLLIPVIIAAFAGADLIIEVIGGQKFVATSAANIFRIFMCFAILLPVDRFLGVSFDILNQPRLNLIKISLMLVVNVAGDFVGIYFLHNIYGVAIASILTFLVGITYGYLMLKRYLNFTFIEIIKTGLVETRLLLIKYYHIYQDRSQENRKTNARH